MLYGLDVGGTKIELAIFDDQLSFVTSWRIPTPKQNYSLFLTALNTMIDNADRKMGQFGSVGIGLPGFVDKNGCIVSANIPAINGKTLPSDTEKILERPVYFVNDVKAFVASEVHNGAAAGAKNVLGVILGTGVSGCLSIDGRIYHGRQNIAGEFGHMRISSILQQRYDLPLRQCGCGNTGCIEQYLAGPGLLWMASHFGRPYPSVVKLMDAVRNNVLEAVSTFNAYIDCLGAFLAQLQLSFDPDVVVLGGGLSNIPEIYDQLPEAIGRHLFKRLTSVPVSPPKFGDSSGVRGAAMMGITTSTRDN